MPGTDCVSRAATSFASSSLSESLPLSQSELELPLPLPLPLPLEDELPLSESESDPECSPEESKSESWMPTAPVVPIVCVLVGTCVLLICTPPLGEASVLRR